MSIKTPVKASQLVTIPHRVLQHQQAPALAYFDAFWSFAIVMLAVVFVVLLMKRSVAEKGTHIGGE